MGFKLAVSVYRKRNALQKIITTINEYRGHHVVSPNSLLHQHHHDYLNQHHHHRQYHHHHHHHHHYYYSIDDSSSSQIPSFRATSPALYEELPRMQKREASILVSAMEQV